ncbi:NAD-dependent epimerase/dehydratase family protein [Nocardioides sambongensis]|uniref:NAD-dependent epimerase/dehydratase family protein n=1 Tax=Nocardioides sambongensis TaxID=2589074 RepID=UPI0011261E6A|nr:NAD-dependent epimerase/dehydratase family protein [Nocardioides sambongensis]
MRVLLTGSAGFIGSAIDSALDAEGHEVVRVDAMLPAAHQGAAAPPHTEVLDVRDADGWQHLLTGVDVVCHQAAVVGAGASTADLPLYAAHNDLGTAALLAAAAGAGVRRLVLASSMVVYGEGAYACPTHGEVSPGPRERAALDAGDFEVHCPACGAALESLLVDESAPLDPRNAYAASKVAQEHYAAAWARQAGGSVVALRYHNVYGPRMPRDTPYSGVAAMFRSSLERGEAPRVFEDGRQRRDFVHVDDVARANVVAAAAVAGAAPGSFAAYNVASGLPTTIAEVAGLVARGAAHPIEPAITGDYRLGDVRHVVASPARAAAELGFRAEVTPEVGLPAFATAPLRG